MPKETINKYIDINNIAKNIMKTDFINLRQIEKFGYEVPDYFKDDIAKIEQAKDLTEVVTLLGQLFDKLAKDQKYDLAMVIQNFLQRYTYFLATNNDYLNHALNINASILDGNNAADIFNAVYVPFFSKQLEFYCADFLDKLNNFDVKDWNFDFYNKIKTEVEAMINEQDFVKKIELAEKFVMENANPNDLYDAIKIDSDKEPNPEKEAFATAFNEFKIVLQSYDNLIENVIKQVREVTTNNG